MKIRTSSAGLAAVTSVLVGAIVVPTTASAAEAAAPCVREDLRLPAGRWQRITVQDADPSGRFQVGWGDDTSFNGHLIRWDNGVPTDLGTPPGSISGINQQGDVIGGAESGDHYTAWRFTDGQVTTLPGLPDSVSVSATAIAPDGTVAGWVRDAGNRRTAVTWSPDNTVHALPGADPSWAVDIDADGTVIGLVGETPVRWAPGAEAEVLPAHDPGPGTSWRLTAISGGTVIGNESDETGTEVVVWGPDGAPVSLGRGEARAVSARGSVAYERPFGNEQLLRQNGVDRALPFGPSPFSVADVVAVTDDDVVYGTHYSTPVKWVCT
jgi:hypothetical protein